MDTLEASRSQIRSRIAALRAALAQHAGLSGWMVPSSDPHLSEYLPERWRGREWLSGFTGSVGTLIVTSDFAGLWVDSRYWVQAEAQLAGTGIMLMRIPAATSTAHLTWLAEHLPSKSRFGVDGQVLSVAAARSLRETLARHDIALETHFDLLEEFWGDRPALPLNAVFEHEAQFAPTSRAEKLQNLRAAMLTAGAQWHLVSTLDDIAWIFNLRGADVSYNPVFVAHALIGPHSAELFVAPGKIASELAAKLARDGVSVAPYEQARPRLAQLTNATVLLDPRRITLGLREALPASAIAIEAINPSTLAKSRKGAAEIDHVRVAMEQDGAALAEFFAWFEATLGKEPITELTIDEHLTAARARRAGFVSPSFGTIAGFNANGAMPHYRATPDSHAKIEGDGLLLIDSGGQYQFGTTDITRVVPVGTPSSAQRRDFTLVLKGMIALSRARFPRGTLSPLLDTLARAPIWAAGVDYGHGTGHGVGYFLNVHEGPQSISPYAPTEPSTSMQPGMITSNEPGIYRPGRWGVRIENLVLTVPAEETEFGEFLSFETLTLCPIDTRCIERALLNDDEIEWLNGYHAMVRARLAPHVTGDAVLWLLRRTEPF
ncbi:MAG: aminopeptidase P family protein [Burkholderiaceae bacterium]|jgi:Xaa-Pro aminopeptidase